MIACGKPMPIAKRWTIQNFCEKYFHDWMSNHKNSLKYCAMKFGAMLGYCIAGNGCPAGLQYIEL